MPGCSRLFFLSCLKSSKAAAFAAFVWFVMAGVASAGDRLLATGGVTPIEGAAGGGLVP